MNAFGLGALRPASAVLEVEGLGRLIHPRRAGAYVVHAIEGAPFEAVQFAPAGLVREAAPELFDESVAAFMELGERLRVTASTCTPRIHAVMNGAEGAFWLQDPVGLTLDSWLLDHPAPRADVIEAFAHAMTAAIEALHAHGLVHGDLSPRTIAIDGGSVKLALPSIDRRGFFRVLRSQSDLVSPGYAPPEAHDGGRRQPIGPGADLYAASAVLRRLITGVAPEPATAIARLAGAPSDDALSASPLRRGIETGMAMAPSERPAGAAAWAAGLGLAANGAEGVWFDGVARAAPMQAPKPEAPEIVPEPPVDADLTIAPPPVERPAAADHEPLGPIGEADAEPRRKRQGGGLASTLLIAGAIVTAAAAGGAAVWLRPAPRPGPAAVAVPAVVPPPMAPAGCQWAPITGGAGWRLACADEPGLVALPERFDTQTATLASRGDVTAMERLGAFYRQRANKPALANRNAYGDEAYAWLARAADSNATGNSEDDRARDDAALALGEMFGRGEGGRAIDPTAAEARLRQAAAGSRADAVLALGQRLWAEAQQDPAAGAEKLDEARRLFSRVARLPDESPLRLSARQALDEIDNARAAAQAKVAAAAAAERAEAARVAEAARAAEAARLAKVAKPAPKAQTVNVEAVKKTARAVLGEARSTLTAAKNAAVKAAAAASRPAPPKPAPKVAAKPAPKRVEAPRPAATPPRTWTLRTAVRIDDPTADFTFEVQQAGHASCEAEGGYATSIRENEVICPNGVPYCQVRISAVCRGQ